MSNKLGDTTVAAAIVQIIEGSYGASKIITRDYYGSAAEVVLRLMQIRTADRASDHSYKLLLNSCSALNASTP